MCVCVTIGVMDRLQSDQSGPYKEGLFIVFAFSCLFLGCIQKAGGKSQLLLLERQVCGGIFDQQVVVSVSHPFRPATDWLKYQFLRSVPEGCMEGCCLSTPHTPLPTPHPISTVLGYLFNLFYGF